MDSVTELHHIILNFIYALWRRRYLILIIILFSPFLGVILYIYSSNKYEASISLATYSLNQNFIKDLPTVPNLEEQFDGLKAYITSPEILKNVAQQTGVLSINASNQQIQGTISSLNKSIIITLSDKNMVAIKIKGNDPKKMIAIINILSSVFMKEFLKPIITTSKSMAVILKKECEEQNNKLNFSIKQLNQFRIENINTNPENRDIYKDQLKNIDKSIEDNEEKYRNTVTEIDWLLGSSKTVSPEISALDKEIQDNDLYLNKMKLLYNDDYEGIKTAEELSFSLKKERDDILKKHPYIYNITNQNQSIGSIKIDSLRPGQLNQYINLQQKINNLKNQINDLKQQKNTLLTTLKKINETQSAEAVFIKAVNNNQAIYNDLLNRYNLAQMMSQLDFEKQLKIIKIMSTPLEPLPYIGHPFSFYLWLSILSGLILSFSLAIIFDLLDNSARKKKTLEALSDVEVISRIGKIN